MIKADMKCAIVIPTHKPRPDEEDEASLRNTLKVLGARHVFVVLPHGVSGDHYEQYRQDAHSLAILNLEPGHLGSIENYNAMGLSSSFYKRFEQFDYLLICHLDSWVFRDDLDHWMSLGYDYIGAPLFLEEPSHYTKLFDLAAPIGGNGGLCLRRTRKMIELTEKLPVKFNYILFVRGAFFLLRNRRFDLLRLYLYICHEICSDHVAFQRKHSVYEDVMISVLYALLDSGLRVAPPSVSKKFCLEVNMGEIANTGLKLRLPFGLHGCDKYVSEGNFRALLRRQANAYANQPGSGYDKPTTNDPLVTVVTLVKNIERGNRIETLMQCIESVRRQSYTHIEHLIVDGASDDRTLEILAEYEAAGVVKIHSSPDKGVWDAMEKGTRLASGEFINFMNSDDYFCDSEAIKIAVGMMFKDRADWFFSGATVIRADGSSYDFPTSIYGVFSCIGIMHQAVFVRKDILQAADPFSTPYTTRENYLFMLLLVNGFKYSYFPGSLVHYREGGLSTNEYGGSNLERTKNDFANYFHELVGKRWRMSHSDCYDMFAWQTFNNRGVKHSLLLGLKLRFLGLRADYFKRLVSYGFHHRGMKRIVRSLLSAPSSPRT
ncbi:DUF5672 family protein [Bradyrhizobium genosp. P]|uniref:DUF5672 family protein n=1 Tax=Bradyrhizobium genosp. P TaxID=83641 RepID=UPI003CF0A0CE